MRILWTLYAHIVVVHLSASAWRRERGNTARVCISLWSWYIVVCSYYARGKSVPTIIESCVRKLHESQCCQCAGYQQQQSKQPVIIDLSSSRGLVASMTMNNHSVIVQLSRFGLTTTYSWSVNVCDNTYEFCRNYESQTSWFLIHILRKKFTALLWRNSFREYANNLVDWMLNLRARWGSSIFLSNSFIPTSDCNDDYKRGLFSFF